MSKCCELNFTIEQTNAVDFKLETQNSLGFNMDSQYEIVALKSYKNLLDKPSINGEVLIDDKSFEDLGEYTLKNSEILDIFNRVFKKGD